jgi:hypothetical protein
MFRLLLSVSFPITVRRIPARFRRQRPEQRLRRTPDRYFFSGITTMPIPTEPIGSIPRPPQLLVAVGDFAAGRMSLEKFQAEEEVLRETIAKFEATGSPIITDGEQTKPSFATYPLSGLKNLAADGAVIPFADGHTGQLP